MKVYKVGENCDIKTGVKMAKKGFPVFIPVIKNNRIEAQLWNMSKEVEDFIKSNMNCDLIEFKHLSIKNGDIPIAIGL